METDESKLQWLVDRALISDLLYSFASSLDTRNWQQYADNFADDGYVELPDPKSDTGATFMLQKQQMLDKLPKSLGRYSATHHLSANHQIAISGEAAQSRSYLQAVHVGAQPTEHWSAGGWYDCQYRRTPQGWKFARVKLTAVWLAGKVDAIKPV